MSQSQTQTESVPSPAPVRTETHTALAILLIVGGLLGLLAAWSLTMDEIALLARARFASWFWWIFNGGLLFAIVFIFWLAFQSIFVIGTLCLWCSLVYLVTIPMFLAVTVRNLRAGLAGRGLQRVGDALAWWVPLLSLLGYVIIFGSAQLHLNILGTLFR